ncbi:MAG TPA: hypothetical protein VH306_03925 [Gaiellaceae bacterium]
MERPHRRVLFALLSVLILSCALAGTASASEIVARNALKIAIKVDGKGHAVVYYKIGGKPYHPVFWGAKNAYTPHANLKQISFKRDYSGGFQRLHTPLWKNIKNKCRRYDGPALPWYVAGCKAPDGSYWTLQRWQRMLPNLGYKPWKAAQKVQELHLAHWTRGNIAHLDLYADWAYSSHFHHLFGRMTYRGVPVYGFGATHTGNPTDDYGRNVYVDTYNSRYAAGWRRENSFLTHRNAGNFCYLFFSRKSYYDSSTRPAGNGQRYRATVIGPGVTPDVRTYVNGLADFDENDPDQVDYENQMDALNRELARNDVSNTPCTNN